jgi:hypothetical protein
MDVTHVTLVPPPISRSQFRNRNRPISRTAGFETGVAVRGLSLMASALDPFLISLALLYNLQ